MCRCVWFVYVFVAGGYILGCRGQDALLSSDDLDQWENLDITLTCTPKTQYRGTFYWYLNTTQSEVLYSYVNRSNCQSMSSWLNNSDMYTVTCIDDYVNSVTIKKISQTRHGEKWKCVFGTGSTSQASNTVQILVKVPVNNVSIRPHTDISTTAENFTFSWHCETSICRPAPRFIWYKSAQSGGENIVIWNVSADSSSADNLVSYSNTYSIRLDRAWNGLYLYCGAHNGNGNVVQSRQILLNVIYPPDGPPRIGRFETGSTINVIKNRIVNLGCSVSGGNPLPTLEWNENNDMPQTVSGNTVTKTLSWKANEVNDHELRCKSTHQLKNDTTYVLAKVLFPPETTEVSLILYTGITSNIQHLFSVIENTSNIMTLICTARSNPIPSSYWWTGSVQSNSARLELNMTRHVRGTYTCNVNNTMIAYDGSIENGYITVSYTIDILQLRNIGELKNVTVVEGENFRMECPIVSGNDTWRSVKWINNQSIPIAQNGSLYMNNVTRSATGTYTCQLDFFMQPTYGLKNNSTVTRGFYLDVLYKAKILRCSINNEANSVIVNETAQVHFGCYVDSNPNSTVEIAIDDKILSKESNIRTVDYVIPSVKCNYTGTYECRGNNSHNKGIQERLNNTLFVNCSPRPSSTFKLNANVTSAQNTSATFSFTAMAYPPPRFKWYRVLNGSEIVDAQEGVITNYSISTTELQINFSFINVNVKQYGQYLLKAENQYGTFNHTFYLIAEDLPIETLTKPRSVGPAVGGAVGGFLAVVITIVSVLVVRKRSVGKRTRDPDQTNDLKDYHTYHNLQNEGHTSIDGASSAVYEKLHHTGTNQHYQQLAVFADINKTSGPNMKVYENLQLSHPNKMDNNEEPSGIFQNILANNQTISSV